MSTPWIDTTLWSCAAALQHGFALSWIFPLWIMSQCSFPSSFTHAVESEFTLFRSQRCIHTHCLIVPLHNALLTQRTVYHSWAQSSCTDPVDIWLIVPTENLSEFPAVSQKAKGKCYLLQSRGGPSAHTAAGYQWASEEMNVSIFQSTLIFCIQFTWGQTELQMLDCRTCQLHIFINSWERLLLNFMGKKVIPTKTYLGCLFLELTGSDSSSRADLHTGTDVECYCHSKGVVHHARWPAFQY